MRALVDPVAIERTCFVSLQNPCNAKCPMCLSWRDDSTLELQSVVEFVGELHRRGWSLIMFTGGEFVTYPGIETLLDLVAELNMDIGFITNGTALSEQFEPTLRHLPVRKVILSRDYADPVRHAVWRALPVFPDEQIGSTLARLRAAGAFVQINTVLTPSLGGALPEFADIGFWSLVDSWHLIPVKGPIARTWSETTRVSVKSGLQQARSSMTCQIAGPAFFDVPLLDVKASRPTERTVHGRACQVERSEIYVDASGEVLPCNSIAWEHRRVVGFGNLNTSSASAILDRRDSALAADHNRARLGCHACDPLNMQHNRVTIT